ncbi:MAG TPA: hypothetical protein DEA97_17595 [Bacteroidales bacterium]|nr:MAG: hypothetical protein UR43_C0030G0002 [candidate division TM6 bacterium GW2011_GWF2_33_332]OFY77318.1 MAG: hypothetical protein A2281_04685 [Bacteroidetes bacterium RIFOXYA12_FULL_38_20]HBS88379.1 hypothetical protein [Bacteroidales bacterium]
MKLKKNGNKDSFGKTSQKSKPAPLNLPDPFLLCKLLHIAQGIQSFFPAINNILPATVAAGIGTDVGVGCKFYIIRITEYK